MGGKGDDNSSAPMMTQQEMPTEGGWKWQDTQTMQRPVEAKKEEEKKKAEPITEDPTKTTGKETVGQEETQPYAPPGFGNYPTSTTNLSPLGDALVVGMTEQPGKKGPVTPQYLGQV